MPLDAALLEVCGNTFNYNGAAQQIDIMVDNTAQTVAAAILPNTDVRWSLHQDPLQLSNSCEAET